jgi:hypothetical protein
MIKHVTYATPKLQNAQAVQLMVQFATLVIKVFTLILLVILVNLVETLDLDVLTAPVLQLAQNATKQLILILIL